MVLPLVGYRSPLPGGGRASLLAADLCVGILDISCVFVALSLCFVPHEPGSGPTLGFRMSLASSFEVASGGLHVGSRCQSWPERLIHGQAGGGGVGAEHRRRRHFSNAARNWYQHYVSLHQDSQDEEESDDSNYGRGIYGALKICFISMQ